MAATRQQRWGRGRGETPSPKGGLPHRIMRQRRASRRSAGPLRLQAGQGPLLRLHGRTRCVRRPVPPHAAAVHPDSRRRHAGPWRRRQEGHSAERLRSAGALALVHGRIPPGRHAGRAARLGCRAAVVGLRAAPQRHQPGAAAARRRSRTHRCTRYRIDSHAASFSQPRQASATVCGTGFEPLR